MDNLSKMNACRYLLMLLNYMLTEVAANRGNEIIKNALVHTTNLEIHLEQLIAEANGKSSIT